MIYLVDNYDSFAHNLARYFTLLGQETVVHRNDVIDFQLVQSGAVDAIVISPGPCTPRQAGKSLELIATCQASLPILGICLGHQAIVQAFGGEICQSPSPMHGRTSPIIHDGTFEYSGLPNRFPAARYHSLIAHPASVPDCLTVSATTTDGTIMSVRHKQLPIVGWQFHPESILTDVGFPLMGGFLKMAGLLVANVPTIDREKIIDQRTTIAWPKNPVTF